MCENFSPLEFGHSIGPDGAQLLRLHPCRTADEMGVSWALAPWSTRGRNYDSSHGWMLRSLVVAELGKRRLKCDGFCDVP